MRVDATPGPPFALLSSVAMVAAALLIVELTATRLFSVLFLHHFSFFAVSLAMTGLALGGVLASRWNLRDLEEGRFLRLLGSLALALAAGVLVALVVLIVDTAPEAEMNLLTVGLRALIFLPAVVASGAFLAAAFARRESWIGRLYAVDLLAAAAAAIGTIFLMRLLQGPAVLLAAAALAALAAICLVDGRWTRAIAWLLVLFAVAGGVANVGSEGRLLRLPTRDQPIFERWNEHSRVLGYFRSKNRIGFVIDSGAATPLLRILPAALKDATKIDPRWSQDLRYSAYWLGRQLDKVAVIGVGAGRDLGPAVRHGASRIDGYELNRIFVDLLREDYRRFDGYYSLADRPEVHLIHEEGRIGIAHADTRYDLIQASMIDTWAATAGGGFVLAENGLYTVQGWRRFMDSLEEDGILTMTRWHLPGASSETQRLVSLAATSLESVGVREPGRHVLLAADARAVPYDDPFGTARPSKATILVSRRPFTDAEVQRFLELCSKRRWRLLWAPYASVADDVYARLLDPTTRAGAIVDSPWDISPPTDQRPYFFLQMRPRDLPSLMRARFGAVTAITFYGVRVLGILSGLAFLFAIGVWVFASTTLPSRESTPPDRRVYRWMSLYFLGIGVGYMLVQLGLHQRLTLILGHPTTTLAVVLASMLLGTGAGSALSSRIAVDRHGLHTWIGIVLVLGLTLVAQPRFGEIEDVQSSLVRWLVVGLVAGVVGLVLGFAFPLGVRIAAPTGQWAVQKLWAVNGAASIAGAALAALIGLGLGSFHTLAAGVICYVAVTSFGLLALRARHRAEAGSCGAPSPGAT